MMKKVKTPGNRNVAHKTLRKVSSFTCSGCGSPLHGIRRMRPSQSRRAPVTQKRLNRAFGSMCSSCSRSLIRARARSA